MKIITAVIALSFTFSAFADQCHILKAKQARNAIDFLKPGSKIGFLCEPCGETKMKKVTVRTVGIQKTDGGSIVIINGDGQDMAYTYTLVNNSRYYNVAGLIGCPAEGVTFDIKK